MLPTPSTSHVCFDRVYEPAEDSYLLLDTISSTSEISFLRNRFSEGLSAQDGAPLVLEVGVGSGVVLAFIAANAFTILGRNDVLTLGTDLNRFACQAASQTVRDAITTPTPTPQPSIFLDIVNGDLASSIRSHSIDVFVFNPPYVPAELPDFSRHESLPVGQKSTTFEQDSYLLELSYAGGPDGMVVTNRMLDQLPEILSLNRGVGYLLLCAQNRPEDVKHRIRGWGPGWRAETVGSSGKKAGWEKLQIVRIWKEGTL